MLETAQNYFDGLLNYIVNENLILTGLKTKLPNPFSTLLLNSDKVDYHIIPNQFISLFKMTGGIA